MKSLLAICTVLGILYGETVTLATCQDSPTTISVSGVYDFATVSAGALYGRDGRPYSAPCSISISAGGPYVLSGGSGFWTIQGTGTFSVTAVHRGLCSGNLVYSPTVTVTILPHPYTLTVNPSIGGSATGGGSYPPGTSAQIVAIPSPGWTFVEWSGAVQSTNNPLSVLVASNMTVQPVFGSSLDLTQPDHGFISASTNTPGLLLPNATVEFVAIPNAGYYLDHWTGGITGSSIRATYTNTSGDTTVSAVFFPLTSVEATLTVIPPTNGKVTLFSYRSESPPTNKYAIGQMLFAHAEADPGYAFDGWSGDATGTENPISIVLDSSKIIGATFSLGYAVTVNQTDGGVVNYSSRKAVYPAGTILDLQAVPGSGFEFAGWGGDITNSQSTIEVVVNTNINLFARFKAPVKQPLWQYQSPSSAVYDPAADTQGRLYMLDRRGVIALDSTGNLLWRTITADGTTMTNSRVAVEQSGNVRVLSSAIQNGSAMIQRLDSTGNLLGAGITIPARLNDISLAADGTLYLSGSRISSVASNDILRWEFRSDIATEQNDGYPRALFGPSLDKSGHVFFSSAYSSFAGGATRLYERSSANGPLLTAALRIPTFDVDSGGPGVKDFADRKFVVDAAPVLANDRIYLVDFDGSLLALKTDGSEAWRFATLDVLSPPSIGADGALYFGAKNSNRFYALNSDGTVRWTRKPGVGGYTVPAIGSDGTVYVSDAIALYALDANGSRRWEYDASVKSPVIAGNHVYATADLLYAFEVATAGAAASAWPMRNASAQNDSVELELPAAPRFEASTAQLELGGFRIRMVVQDGVRVGLYASSDLKTWTLVGEQVAANGGVEFSSIPTGSSARFYKAQLE